MCKSIKDCLFCRCPPTSSCCARKWSQDATKQARNSSQHRIRDFGVGLLAVPVEVVSPESVSRDYETQTLEYATFGVDEYWIIDPLQAKVTLCLLVDSVYNQTVLTGSQQIVSRLFPQINLTAQQLLAAKL